MKAMIRNISIIIIVVFAVIAIHIYICSELGKRANEIYMYTGEIINYVNEEKYKEAFERSGVMKAEWEKCSDKMALYVDHSSIESIGIYITIMESHLKNGSYPDALAEANRIMAIAEDMVRREKITIENIF